jgi:TRAP transporter 4TM/12TM fusion protein
LSDLLKEVQIEVPEDLPSDTPRFRSLESMPKPLGLLIKIFLIAVAPVGCFFILDGPGSLGWSFLMQQYYGIILAMMLPPVFLLIPMYKGAYKKRLPWYDILLAILAFGIGLYIVIFYPDILRRMGVITPDRVIMGTIAIVLIIEAVRRLTGWAMAILGIAFILYAYLNYLIPGAFGGKVMPWSQLANYLFLDTNALLSVAMDVTASIVLPYVLFSNLLHGIGGGPFLNDFAMSLFGGFRGGPAKISVVASSLFGTISGSAVANVVGTGVVTIPLMKRVGYKPHFAAAVEAVSSTGGQLMPPVMGAAAFVMSEFTGIPYAKIALAALIPAILYYIGIFIQVDLEAGKNGLKGLPRNQLPSLRSTLKKSHLFFIPLLVLAFALFALNMEAGKAALVGSASILLIGLIQRKTRTSATWLVNSLQQTGQGILELTSVVAMAGFIIGVVTVTGLAFLFPFFMGQLAGGNLFLLVLIVAVAALILGMGMPTVAVYVILSLLLAPAMVKLGVPVLAAHMFIFYWGMLSMITPPVCFASFAAAALAGADMMRTGYAAMRIGILVFIVPFMFVFGPALLLIGEPMEIFLSVGTAIIGSFMVGIATVGYLFRNLNLLQRIIVGLAGLGLLIPIQQGEMYMWAMIVNILGAVVSALFLWWEWRLRKKLKKASQKSEYAL